MTSARQILWAACFLVGVWLGARAGSPGGDGRSVAPGADGPGASQRSQSTTGPSSPHSSGAAAAPGASIHRKKKPKPEDKVRLEDLRRLLETEIGDANLTRTFHLAEKTLLGLPVADLPAAAAMLWEQSSQKLWASLFLAETISRWAEADPKAALAWMKTLSGNETFVFYLRARALEILGKKNPDLLWSEIGQRQEWMDDRWVASGFIGRAFGKSPELGKKFLDSVTDPGVRRMAVGMVIGALAEKDVQAALALARSLPDARERESALREAYKALAASDPDAALAALRTNTSEMPASIRQRLLAKLAEDHPDRARQFISDGGLRRASQEEATALARGIRKSIGELAALAAHVPEGPPRDAFLGAIAERLAEGGELDAAWKALQNVKPGLERQSAMQGYSANMACKSAAEASSWLAALPAGHDRDAAIRGFVFAINSQKPQMACEWALAVSDSVYREDMIESAFSTWHEQDAPAAEAWLSTSAALSADEKSRLLEGPQRP